MREGKCQSEEVGSTEGGTGGTSEKEAGEVGSTDGGTGGTSEKEGSTTNTSWKETKCISKVIGATVGGSTFQGTIEFYADCTAFFRIELQDLAVLSVGA